MMYVRRHTLFNFISDDHDVIKFAVHSLRSPEMALVPDSVNEEESKRFEQEFQQYQTKLKDQKDQWAREHPDQVCPKKVEDNFAVDLVP